MAEFNNSAMEDPEVLPLYAHSNLQPVRLNSKYIEAQDLIDKTDVFKGAVASLEFHYLIYAFRQLSLNPKNLITIEYVISEVGNGNEPFVEKYDVSPNQIKLLGKFISTPLRVFDHQDKRKRILTFKERCPMTLKSFKELLNTWAKS